MTDDKLSTERREQLEQAIAQTIQVSLQMRPREFLTAARSVMATIDDAGLQVVPK